MIHRMVIIPDMNSIYYMNSIYVKSIYYYVYQSFHGQSGL